MKDIFLRIIGKQTVSGDEGEQIEFITEGKYYEEDSSVVLLYNESELSGIDGCVTSLRVTGDKIRMERSGGIVSMDTAIEFEKGRRFKGYYDTMFGTLEMEVLTNNVKNYLEKKSAKGFLDIDYIISLKGLLESRSRLKIEIM
jgi:uncharacterized beta-barrel protein YwiB (DUF1934 family)